MFSMVISGALRGIDSYLAEVEIDTAKALPCFEMVGYLGSEVREARERVRTALKNTGILLPPLRVTVNMSPADIRKEGTTFDLAIAVGIMVSLGHIPEECIKDTMIVGELGLDGEIKSVRGILSLVMEGRKGGCKRCILPAGNTKEGAAVAGIEVIGAVTLLQVQQYLSAPESRKPSIIPPAEPLIFGAEEFKKEKYDFWDVRGQAAAKRAIEVAAAGFHNILLSGPPGSGKTMLAKRIPTILPHLTLAESMEVSKVYSACGILSEDEGLITKRPFLNPHHTISPQALSGGGKIPRPGVMSLSHRGVLFLDELPEFKRAVIESLRQPLEDRKIHIARSYGSYTFPADFMMAAAMNPCPCGYYPDANRCRCKPYEVRRYLNRISGPIMDRMDITVVVSGVEWKELKGRRRRESSARIRSRVMEARSRQERRYRGTLLKSNADLGAGDIRKYAPLGAEETALAEKVYDSMGLSARSYHRMIKVARTIADLDASDRIRIEHISEAVGYRSMDNGFERKE